MLTRFIVVILFLASALPVQAQYQVSAVSFGSGETPIASGVSVAVDLTTESGGYMQVMAQSQQAWFMLGKDWKIGQTKCSLYGSVGHFQGAPWVGPYAGCNVTLAKVAGRDVVVGAMT